MFGVAVITTPLDWELHQKYEWISIFGIRIVAVRASRDGSEPSPCPRLDI
jgi:hypothetical protein